METACAPANRSKFGESPAWLKRLRETIVGVIRQGLTPEKASLALAVGFACAFFPILGAATPLCVAAGLVLRLNQGLIQLMNGLTFPFYAPLVLIFVRLGDLVLGSQKGSLDLKSMPLLARTDPAELARQLGRAAGHALIGWALVAPVLACLIYGLCLPATRALARKPRAS
jgi:uncharacterized protein (DUF2062 family)